MHSHHADVDDDDDDNKNGDDDTKRFDGEMVHRRPRMLWRQYVQ